MPSEAFDTELDAYRERVSRPLFRLFRAYESAERRWLVLGLLASVFAYGTVLVTPIVLGTTIDAVFTGESAYGLPLVPSTWLPAEPAAQFRLSAAVVGTVLLGGALLQWVRDVSMNDFAHGVMYAIRVDTGTGVEGYSGSQSVDYETLLDIDPDALLRRSHGDTTRDEFESEIVAELENHTPGTQLTAVQEGNVFRGGPIYCGPLHNLFMLERYAKASYPDEFTDERLFDRQRVADIVNGDS